MENQKTFQAAQQQRNNVFEVPENNKFRVPTTTPASTAGTGIIEKTVGATADWMKSHPKTTVAVAMPVVIAGGYTIGKAVKNGWKKASSMFKDKDDKKEATEEKGDEFEEVK